jgi:hypothetical protein
MLACDASAMRAARCDAIFDVPMRRDAMRCAMLTPMPSDAMMR